MSQTSNQTSRDLGKDIFLLISSLTPIINVDILVKNSEGKKLLAWREDEFYGPGWHIPGGVVRFKETFSDRIKAVALKELSCTLTHKDEPDLVRQIMNPNRDIRGHFVSLLFCCSFNEFVFPPPLFKEGIKPAAGDLAWFDSAPADLIPQHKIYVNHLNDL